MIFSRTGIINWYIRDQNSHGSRERQSKCRKKVGRMGYGSPVSNWNQPQSCHKGAPRFSGTRSGLVRHLLKEAAASEREKSYELMNASKPAPHFS